jgi:hypothetical protein
MAKAKTHKSGAAYYAGGHRYIKNGIPCRMAPWFGTMSESARAMIGRGSFDPNPNAADVQAQRHPQTTYLPTEA